MLVGQGSTKTYIDSHCVIRVIDEQGEAIGRLHETIHNTTKNINSMSTTMGGMTQGLHNMGKEMEYYAAKNHQVEKYVEVNHMFFHSQFLKQDKNYMLLLRSIRSLQFHT